MADESSSKQVVVGVDGSAGSVAALRWAADYGQATGATVQAVIAWHYPDAGGGPPVGHAPAPVRQESEQHIQSTLDQAVGQAFPDGVPAVVQTRISYGHPAQVLIDESKTASLLVVGNRGHSAFTGLLLGSVSIHCVTGAFCPVTVVRSA
jgi:nucleotide-binding universal stress UspA family protein